MVLDYAEELRMIKLKRSYNKVFKIFIVIYFFSFPGFSAAGEISNQYIQKSRLDPEVLLGTWDFSYNIGETIYSSKVDLTEIVYSDEYGFSIAKGLFYQDESDEGEWVACSNYQMDHPLYIRTFSTDFSCIVELSASPFRLTFIFNMTANNITKGLFSFGDTNDEVGENIVHNNFPFMGSSAERVGSPANGDSLEAFYYIIQDELDIPVVHYRGSGYRVILKNEGDFRFSIKYALPTSLAIEGEQTVYNESSHELIIPRVNYDGSRYRIELEKKGDLFTVKDVQTIN